MIAVAAVPLEHPLHAIPYRLPIVLPPMLADVRRALTAIRGPRSDEQDALLAELEALDDGRPVPASGGGDGSRSLGGVMSVCPMCQRAFGAA